MVVAMQRRQLAAAGRGASQAFWEHLDQALGLNAPYSSSTPLFSSHRAQDDVRGASGGVGGMAAGGGGTDWPVVGAAGGRLAQSLPVCPRRLERVLGGARQKALRVFDTLMLGAPGGMRREASLRQVLDTVQGEAKLLLLRNQSVLRDLVATAGAAECDAAAARLVQRCDDSDDITPGLEGWRQALQRLHGEVREEAGRRLGQRLQGLPTAMASGEFRLWLARLDKRLESTLALKLVEQTHLAHTKTKHTKHTKHTH